MAAAAAAAEAIVIGEEQELDISAPTKTGLMLEEDELFNPKFRKWDQEDDAILIQEADNEKNISKGFLRPDGQTRAAWEGTMMSFTMYCAFSIPVQMAWATRPSGALAFFEFVMDTFFIADVAINFRTGFYDTETSRNVYDQKQVAMRYLKGWLVFDLIAAFPLSFFRVIAEQTGGTESGWFGTARVLRIWSRALRMLKIIRMNKLFQSLQNNHEFNPAYMRIFKFAAYMTIYMHVTACAWFGIGVGRDPADQLQCDNTDSGIFDYFCQSEGVRGYQGSLWEYNSWQYQAGISLQSCTSPPGSFTARCTNVDLSGSDDAARRACEGPIMNNCTCVHGCRPFGSSSCDSRVDCNVKQPLECGATLEPCVYTPAASFWSQYHAAMYWAMATVTTVGYGDISARTHDERMYAIFSMSAGAITFAFVCGNMTSLVINLDKEGHLFQKKLDMLNSYMRQRELTRPLKVRTRTFCRHVWGYSAFNESAVLADLSPGLRMQLAMEINAVTMRQVPLFSELSVLSLALLCQKLRAVFASPSELVVQYGDVGREMYIVRSGVLDVISGDGKVKYASLRKGSYFGEIAVVLGQKRTANVRARKICDLFVLVQKDFNEAFEPFPLILEEMKRKANAMIEENKQKDTMIEPKTTPRFGPQTTGSIITDGNIDLRKCSFVQLADIEIEARAIQKRRAMQELGLSIDEIERRALEKKVLELRQNVEHQRETVDALENQENMG